MKPLNSTPRVAGLCAAAVNVSQARVCLGGSGGCGKVYFGTDVCCSSGFFSLQMQLKEKKIAQRREKS